MKKKVKPFEEKHRIISFLIIFIIIIVLTRLITSLKDPNIIFRGFELHHFYYGLILLIIASLLMLYRRASFKTHLILTSIALGLIADEAIFIAGKVRGPITYSATLNSTIIIAIAILLIIEFVFYKIKGHKEIN
jgi:hypothetical protein